MAVFTNSSNINISGQPTFTIQNPSPDTGLETLYMHAAPGALHDSGERFDPPNCHPGTRTAVLEEIMSWIDDVKSNFPVMWMKGAMGGGKSSIAQALAELYHQRRQLLGSFFFARASPARNNEKRLVATLAYQMAKEIPQIRPYISAPILHDPLIFDSSLKAQIEALIIQPHSYILSSDGSATSKPRLIIIDGLDECVNREPQALIVKSFVSSTAEHRAMSLKILIVSRPEIEIENAFCAPNALPFVKHLLLDERWLPSDDIRRFLTKGFEDIRRDHPIRMLLPEDWPANPDVEKIVEKSSSQFIYASVVIKFLQAPRNHPIESLNVILGLSKDTQSRPYAQLDALYEHIFSQVKDLPLVLRILCIRLQLAPPQKSSFSTLDIGDTTLIRDILDLPLGMLSVALTDLVSVLRYNQNGRSNIFFYHASLSEFLLDRDRSGKFYVNSEEICFDLAGRCIPFHKTEDFETIRYRLYFFKFVYGKLSVERQSLLCDALPDMDILPSLKYCTLCVDTIVNWTDWFFAEHARNAMTKCPSCLDNAMKLCVEYILRQFKAFPFNGIDRTDGADVWIFAAYSDMHGLLLTREVCAILTGLDSSEFANLEISQSAKFCWQFLPYIPFGTLENVELFGKYAMTGDRYVNGAIRLFKAITTYTSGNMLVFANLTALLSQTPASKGLFKIFKESMVERSSEPLSEDGSLEEPAYQYVPSTYRPYGFNWKAVGYLVSAISDYMEKTREAIPNIDSIIEEEWKAEHQLTNTSSEVSRWKVTARLREFFRMENNADCLGISTFPARVLWLLFVFVVVYIGQSAEWA